MRRFTTLVCAGAALAACDDGGGAAPRFDNFDELVASADAMAASYVDLETGALRPGVTPTAPGDLPATGDATYTGYISGDVSGDRMVGELTMTTFFDAPNAILGTASGFVHEADGAYGGTLALNGTVTPAGATQITATAAGTLDNQGTSYPTTLSLSGNFLGTDYGAVAGTANGTVGADAFGGGFVAER